MKRIILRLLKISLIAVVLTSIPLLLFSCSNSSTNTGEEAKGNVDTFRELLTQDGFTVQEGNFKLTDAIELFNNGITPDCNGNNSGNPYYVYQIPQAPGQTLPNQVENRVYPLRADEAIVLVGKTPPEMKYFSYCSFMTNRYFDDINNYKKIYASLGDTINYATISTEGTPGGEEGNPFNQPVMIITTADKGINSRIRNAAIKAGYPEIILNTNIIPSALVNMGLDYGCDTFSFLGRTAKFIDVEACERYQQDPGVRVFRLTPIGNTALDPFPTPKLRQRGTGKSEMDMMPAVEDLRKAILAAYPDYEATELQTTQWLSEAYESIQGNENVLGESRDTSYLRTIVEDEFLLPDNPDDFLIVYGVNHEVTGKAIYSNFVIYGASYFNGVASVSSDTFLNSAADYINGHEKEKYLYAWKVKRSADGEIHCLEVPTGPQAYGIPLDSKVFVGFRAYVEPETEVGPAYNEIIYDRVIHFTKKN